MSFAGMAMLCRREIARYMNVWGQTVVPPIVTAGLLFFVFGHALGGRIGDFGGVPYLTFLVPGVVIQGAIISAYSNTSSSLFDARRAGYIDDVLTSPLKDWQIVVAYTVAAASRGLLVALLTAVLALPVASAWAIDVPLLLAVAVLACLVFALIGMAAGVWATRWDHVLVPVSFVLTPLTFLGGMFYPVSELPPGLAAATRFNPILYIVDATRAAMLGVHDLPVLPSLLLLVVLTVALYFGVLRAFSSSTKLRG